VTYNAAYSVNIRRSEITKPLIADVTCMLQYFFQAQKTILSVTVY